MKNYFQKIITLFTGNDYPESTQQDFYKWLVDEEHTSEKDEALQNYGMRLINRELQPTCRRLMNF